MHSINKNRAIRTLFYLAHDERLLAAAKKGFATATDLADYLVRRGVPFRDAHEIVGKAVKSAIEANKDLEELELTQLQALSTKIEGDVYNVLELQGSVGSRNLLGGTAPAQVNHQIAAARKRLGIK